MCLFSTLGQRLSLDACLDQHSDTLKEIAEWDVMVDARMLSTSASYVCKVRDRRRISRYPYATSFRWRHI